MKVMEMTAAKQYQSSMPTDWHRHGDRHVMQRRWEAAVEGRESERRPGIYFLGRARNARTINVDLVTHISRTSIRITDGQVIWRLKPHDPRRKHTPGGIYRDMPQAATVC